MLAFRPALRFSFSKDNLFYEYALNPTAINTELLIKLALHKELHTLKLLLKLNCSEDSIILTHLGDVAEITEILDISTFNEFLYKENSFMVKTFNVWNDDRFRSFFEKVVSNNVIKREDLTEEHNVDIDLDNFVLKFD